MKCCLLQDTTTCVLYSAGVWDQVDDHMYNSLCLWTGAPGSGKTAIAAHMAKQSDFPFLKICAPKSMIGYHEAAKVQAIKKVMSDSVTLHHFVFSSHITALLYCL